MRSTIANRFCCHCLHSILFFSLLVLSGCGSGPARYLPKEPPPPLPAFYVPERIRVAVVLGSGGVRGTAHLGVLEELEAAGIPIDLIVGCSAGSIVGSLYADKASTAAIKTAVWKIRANTILDIDLWTCRYGLSKSGPMRRVLDKYLCAQRFDQLKIPFIAVATDLYSGELVPMGGGDLVKAVQASCSIPFVFVPCKHLGRVLVDGGVINPVPVKIAKDLGAEIIIAVDLCELLEKTCPSNLFEIADRSAEIAFMWQNQACASQADVIIRPKTCGVGTFNDDLKWQTYLAGKHAARQLIPTILQKLAALPRQPCMQKRWRLVNFNCYKPQICQSN